MKTWLRTEDGWAVLLGFVLVALGVLSLTGVDLLGWVVNTKVWIDFSKAMNPASDYYKYLPGYVCLLFTYLFLLALLLVAAFFLKLDLLQFTLGFTVLFGISYACWLLGSNAYLAATPDQVKGFGLSRSLGLTNEAGFLIALVVGLLIGNFLPGVASWLKEAARTELYIKTAIVILGASLALKTAGQGKLVSAILFRGLAAIVEAYLIYSALVYYVARRFFGFSREWAAPLASGISICGVSAAITTGAAIRARPVVPVMVSSLVVVFSVFELLLLPLAARTFLADQPMVAAAWMGLAVKTDGAAVASGAITEALIMDEAAQHGVHYQKDMMKLTTTTVKVFIDLFIGAWAFVLAVVWAYGIDRKPGQGVPIADIWNRFPKFVFGYFVTFAILAMIVNFWPGTKDTLKTGLGESDLFRQFFFVMTFFAIGLSSNFKKLWAEGLARLALVYVVCLFGFIIWIGLVISWLFFHGVMPPIVSGAS